MTDDRHFKALAAYRQQLERRRTWRAILYAACSLALTLAVGYWVFHYLVSYPAPSY